MNNKPRPSSSNMLQISPTIASQLTSTTVSSSASNYVLTSNNLRSVSNYTLVSGSQVPVTHQYNIVQSAPSTSVPQYVSTGNVRHILSSGSQPSNMTYMLPSGAHIVRMNNVVTTTVAGDQKPSTQFILTSSSQRESPKIGLGTIAESSSELLISIFNHLYYVH